ncbi:hypothetical protein AKO1_015484 [Acrasis kona]|uniref:Uncharacterized protein n=1 Tax=Acrasis kona TaxID=1008807 RepID=A0AAW2ZFZ3_9EUKA
MKRLVDDQRAYASDSAVRVRKRKKRIDDVDDGRLMTPNSRCITPIIHFAEHLPDDQRRIHIVTVPRTASQLSYVNMHLLSPAKVRPKRANTITSPVIDQVLEEMQSHTRNRNDISDLTKKENRLKSKYIRNLLDRDSAVDNTNYLNNDDVPSSRDFMKECDEFAQSIAKTLKESKLPQIHKNPKGNQKRHKDEHPYEHHDDSTYKEDAVSHESTSGYLNGLPRGLLFKITELKNNPSKYNDFKKDIGEIIDKKKKIEEEEREKNLTYVKNNIEWVHDDVNKKTSMMRKSGFRERDKKIQHAQLNKERIENERINTLSAEFTRTLDKMSNVEQYESSRERYQAFVELNHKKTWIEAIIISKLFIKLNKAIVLQRSERNETVQLNENATSEQREQFKKHKAAIYEEIKKRPSAFRDIELFDTNVYIARMRWKFRRKQIAAHMIRVSLLGFVDIQTILRAARKFKEHVKRAQRIVREYLLMKRCREKLMDLQFAKIESQIRRKEREELASDLLKTSASINLQLSPSLVKEMKKVRLESLKRSSGFRKTKVQNEEVEIQSLIPENLRITVIRENLTRRKRAFIKKILSEEKSRVGNMGNSHRYQRLKPKYVFKSMIGEDEMLTLVASARKMAGEHLREKSI